MEGRPGCEGKSEIGEGRKAPQHPLHGKAQGGSVARCVLASPSGPSSPFTPFLFEAVTTPDDHSLLSGRSCQCLYFSIHIPVDQSSTRFVPCLKRNA
ncbi:hypothetical protein HYQ46_009551 [Verticillium longisporum]|nr:hypothetical protein HYQ46_009551 [Verticillium longisporum]